MINPWKVATGILTLGIIWDYYAGEVNRSRMNKLNKKNEILLAELEDRRRLVNLYAKKLNDNNVEMDDFDQIIMEELIK